VPNFTPLDVGEDQLTNPIELIWRQCAPGHFDVRTGMPTAEIFRPTSADGGKLSGARSDKVGAKGAYDHRVVALDRPSAGCWAVSVGEVESLHSRVVDDNVLLPPPPPPPPPGHVYIDLRHLLAEHESDKTAKNRFRSTLLILMHRRGIQHP